jgi:pimeloyl-ACP methyl ester carboxylesterase
MRRIAVIATVPVLLIAIGMSLTAWRYEQQLAIDSSDGINEAGYVRIGGIDQWIQIRGQHKANPVLLWLNGGPGFSTIPSTVFYTGWEKYFTVVMWDQRGEGKTFEKSGTSVAPSMTVGRMAQDGLEVAAYLRARLHKEKIIVLGHSWGSILGVHMVKQRPDFFYAYVGTGQVQHLRKDMEVAYPLLLRRAQAENNQQAIRELAEAGPPPYAQTVKYFVDIKWANALDPPGRGTLSLAGIWGMGKAAASFLSPGVEFSQRIMIEAMLDEDLPAAVTKFDVPVVVIEGDADLVTPQARAYFDKIMAPHKEFLLLSGAGHLAIFRDSVDFLKLLIDHVLPLAK